MDPFIAQMISDATTLVDDAIAAGGTHATTDVRSDFDPKRSGEPSSYKGRVFPELDLLTLSIPLPGKECLFRLIVNLGLDLPGAATYVVTQQGNLRRAQLVGFAVVLSEVDDATTAWLAGRIHEALLL